MKNIVKNYQKLASKLDYKWIQSVEKRLKIIKKYKKWVKTLLKRVKCVKIGQKLLKKLEKWSKIG